MNSNLLNKFVNQEKLDLEELFDSCKGLHFNALWHNTFNWKLFNEEVTFHQKRQLFFELINHYMDAGLMRFDNFILDFTKPEEWKPGGYSYQTIKWSKSDDQYPSKDEVLAYLEAGFLKDEAEFELESDRYFYNYCPFVYWLDEETGEWWAS